MKSHLLNFAVTFFLTLGAVIGYWFWYTAVAAQSAVAADLQNQIITKTETIGRITLARTALTEISGNEMVLQNYFVPEGSVVSFIDGLEAIGKAQKSSVGVLSVSSETVNERPMLVLAVSINGTFDSVMRTVGAIEYAPYDLTIQELSITKNGNSDWHASTKLLVGSTKTASSTP